MVHTGALNPPQRNHVNACGAFQRTPGAASQYLPAQDGIRERRLLYVTVSVSRKTALDGRLEIPESLAHRLLSHGEPLSLDLRGDQEPVTVEEMPCTCTKVSASGRHVHHFLSSEVLKSLPAGANVDLVVDVEQGLIGIELVT